MTRASPELKTPAPEVCSTRVQKEQAAPANWERSVRDAVSGHAAATRRVLGEVIPSVRAICRSVLGQDHPQLEDAVQESLVELLRSLPQFRFEADLSHYAMRIALRRAISAKKKSARDSRRLALNEDTTADFDEAVAVTSQDLVLLQRRQLVRDLLIDLSERQAEVVVLRLLLGYSVAEAAKMTGVSSNTVKTRLLLAKQAIRRRIKRNPEWRAAFTEVVDD